MAQKYYIFIGVIILAILAGIFSYPNYFDKSVDFLNQKFSWTLPHFPEKAYVLGLDLQGGVRLVYRADLSTSSDKSGDMSRLRDLIERRVNAYGVSEPVVQVQNPDRLVVELPGITNVEQAIQRIGQTPYLEFDEQRTEEESKPILDKIKEIQDAQAKGEDIQKIKDWQLALENPYFKPTDLTGKYLKVDGTRVNFDQINKPIVELQFNDEGAKLFEEITGRNIAKKLAIFLDGNSIVDNTGDGKIDAQDFYNPYAPVVQNKITGGKAQITGNMTIDGAKKLVNSLKDGALPVKIGSPISQETVGPTLGSVSLHKSLVAGLYGLLAVVIFMVIFYRFPGLLASFALVIYVAISLSIFKLMPVITFGLVPFVFTLAGIGGFILSIGMAVDANILIFARMKEEIKAGKSLASAIDEGFRRAWPSIRDSNFNSLIVCAILFAFATSFIKGFALTLSIGIIVSLFSAIFITRIFLQVFVGKWAEKVKWIL